MMPAILKYKSGYTYDEYKHMCDVIGSVKLPFLSKWNINLLISDYVFSASTNRIKLGWKHTLCRLAGNMFCANFDIESEDDAEVVFAFTGSGQQRPDYVENLKNVISQCDKPKCVIMSSGRKRRFNPLRFFSIFPIIVWAFGFNKKISNFSISLDMALLMYRALANGKKIWKTVYSSGAKKLVTYCDQWSSENALTQIANKNGLKTATLQHGNGTEIFYGNCSQIYLANSLLSAVRKEMLTGKSGNTKVLEPMKFIGQRYGYIPPTQINSVGIILDGGSSKESNLDMIVMAHRLSELFNASCVFKFHPSTDISTYADVMDNNDIISKDNESFENENDLFIACKSTYYQELVFKCKSILRYRFLKDDWYPEVTEGAFENITELNNMIDDILHPQLACKIHDDVYAQIFGNADERMTYETFFKTWEDTI